MKGLVILLLVASTAFEASSTSKPVPDRAFHYRPGGLLRPLPSMLQQLGKPIAGDVNKGAREVLKMLIDTYFQHKDTPDPRLNDFTVSQLIELNEISNEDCRAERLQQRRTTCETFSTKEQAMSDQVVESGDLVANSDAQIKLNLGKYCWGVIMALGSYCPMKRVLALGEVAMKRLSSFEKQVSFGMNTAKQIFFPDKIKVVTRKLKKLEEQDANEAEALKETCSFIANEFSEPESLFAVGLFWPSTINLCKLVDKIKNDAL